jgi:4-aminobutyrate aminotransferase
MILARDKRFMSPSVTRAYPLVIDEGKGLMVRDVDGNCYLDFTSGVAVNTLGHSHPEIIEAIAAQSKRFIHMAGVDFYYQVQVDLAEKLSQMTPGRFDKKVFLVNSGTEAVEAAIKLARYVTGRPRILAFMGSFHGRTMGSLSLTASKAVQRRRFSPLMPEVTHAPFAYCYRCPFNSSPNRCRMHCVLYIREWIFQKVAPPEDIACLVVEPIQGEGGYIVPPPQYFKQLRGLCDEYGILMVVDEIQSGMGRTGKMFAIEHWDVVPDIICIAKGIASGFPIGAMVARSDLHVWGPGAHANTFGGNPVACAAALKTIELLSAGLIANAREVGGYLHRWLDALVRRYSILGDHRGIGLMQAVEIVKDKRTRQKAPALRDRIVRGCFERGLLLLGCGDNSVRFIPPLIVEKAHIDTALKIFEDTLRYIC